ncbi:MBL fold metallo-hydrolase [Georgenia sp. SUBG003]|uniref:MBL fold metallo-hydrolase n=1 Tax=Georgenia sp. SUBG003 TaxID=1497974 RepID=UPI00069423C0
MLGAGYGPLADGELLDVGGLAVRVLATPGHTGDSVSFLLAEEGLLLTGDTVLGRGTTVLGWPDGTVADYLRTLDTLLAMTGEGRVTRLAPGHGPPVEDPAAVLAALRDHRVERLGGGPGRRPGRRRGRRGGRDRGVRSASGRRPAPRRGAQRAGAA